MAPKKAQPASKLAKADVTLCGLTLESCPFSYWEEYDWERDSWGDLSATHVDSAALFTDPDAVNPTVAVFGSSLAAWQRPSAVFSPFKPVVFRAGGLPPNPYEWDPKDALPADRDDEPEAPRPTTRAEMVAEYRTMKAFRSHFDDDAHASGSPSRHGHTPARAKSKNQGQTQNFMRCFNAALMVLQQKQDLLPAGNYAWELIYPHLPGTQFPQYNPTGKYAVRLFYSGAFRKVVIDDRLPTDPSGRCLLTVTEQKEVWPALIAKAMLKVLGTAHESLLIQSPAWLVSCLLCGYTPQIVSPAQDEVLVHRFLRSVTAQSMQRLEESNREKEPLVLCATCGDSSQHNMPLPEPEDAYTSVGLVPNQAYTIICAKPFRNTTLVHLCGPGGPWKGPYAYDSAQWTKEVEDAVDYKLTAERRAADVLKRWNDFWVPWEMFVRYFRSAILFRSVTDKRYAFYKQILYTADATESKPAAKGSPAAAASASEKLPKSATKWLYVNSPHPVECLITFSGLAKPRESDTYSAQTTVVIHHFDWTKSCPQQYISSMAAGWGIAQSTTLHVPSGASVYRIAVDQLPADCMVSVMSPVEVTLGEEKDVCKDVVGVTTSSDAGVYGEHNANATTLWFKRALSVKQPTTCNFSLTTLPKGTDISQYKQVQVEAPSAAASKSKQAAKPAKGQQAQQSAETADEEIDATEHATPISDYVTLSVLNLDTNTVTTDTIGKILGFKLVPNKSGYVVMAFATPPERYGKGYWRLTAMSDHAFETFEPRGFEETLTRTGEYFHNDVSSLFRYALTVGELASASIQITVQDSGVAIPFTASLLWNDKVAETRSSNGSCFFEHVVLQPSEKTAASIYGIHCTLDSAYTAAWEEQRRVLVVRQFRSDCVEQEKLLLQRQKDLRELLQTNPEAQLPPENGARPGSVPSTHASILYTLTIHCSTPKVEVKQDNSIIETLTQIKQTWATRDKPPADAAPAKGKPSKNQPQVDELQVRQTKAKEARERFLNNRRCVFIPFVSNGKPILTAEQEPGSRMVAPADESDAVVATRVHGGIMKGTVLHDGLRSAPCDAEMPGGAASAGIPSSEPPLAPQKEQLDHALAETNQLKERKKAVYARFVESSSSFFAELRPDKTLLEQGADDDKSKGKGAKAKAK